MNKSRIAAVFDVDGTLISGDTMERTFVKRLGRMGEIAPRHVTSFAGGVIGALMTGRSPLKGNKAYLRGHDATRLRRLARECFEEEIMPRLLPEAINRLRWHQQAGHFVILLSGTLDPLLEPLAENLGVSARIGTDLEVEGKRLTGKISGPHPYGKAKAECLMLMNRLGLFDINKSFAYADSYADRHLLGSVGNPIATNADHRLRFMAECRGWIIEDFTHPQPNILMEKVS